MKDWLREMGYYQSLLTRKQMTVSEWADQHRMLSPEASSEPGRWRTNRVEYLREIMDVLTDPAYPVVVLVGSSQIAKTEGLVNNYLGYLISQDPCPILHIRPTLEEAQTWSKDRFAPMIRDTPILNGTVVEARGAGGKSSEGVVNNILHKSFPGGRLAIVGSNATSGLRSRPVRIVIGDELDDWEPAAGDQGDQIELARRRQETFWNKKLVLLSTPGLKSLSRIERYYEESDQRQYHVPCPHCQHKQLLTFANLQWDKQATTHLPWTAHFVCETCGQRIEERHKQEMLRAGQWRAEYPGRSTAGFRLWAAYSPWKQWMAIAEDFLRAKRLGREAMKTFTNTVLGETFDEPGERPEWEIISARQEPRMQWVIPDEVLFLTAGVDVQDDRIEISVWGWGMFEEGWLIGDQTFWGKTNEMAVYEELSTFLQGTWEQPTKKKTHGLTLVFMDSGHRTNLVYIFTRTRPRVYAIRGAKDQRARIVGRPTLQDVDYGGQTIKDGAQLWSVGVHVIKKDLYGRLLIPPPGPRSLHFPHGMGDEYYEQLTAEKLEKKYHKGYLTEEWKQIRPRNEALDKYVYAYAAAYQAAFSTAQWASAMMRANPAPTLTTAPKPEPPPPAQPVQLMQTRQPQAGFQPRPRRRGGLMQQLLRG